MLSPTRPIAPKTVVFDHIRLEAPDRALIARACANHHVKLAELDKGASGSRVWQARWEVSPGYDARDHVFKIGPAAKLKREEQAIRNIVAPIDPAAGHVSLFRDEARAPGVALLRQEFGGRGVVGAVVSLRQHFNAKGLSASEAEQTVTRLYRDRMSAWHHPIATPVFRSSSLACELDWWTARTNLARSATDLGRTGLRESLRELFRIDLPDVERIVDSLGSLEDRFTVGPVHGDLHAQNILVDEALNLHLIDFGWTAVRWRAVDFLMLECSLKFLVAPPHARLVDLIAMELELERVFIDGTWNAEALTDLLYGRELIRTAAAIAAVRRLALDLGAVADYGQYRRGLAFLTAGLASIPQEINRNFLFHSLAAHTRELDQ